MPTRLAAVVLMLAAGASAAEETPNLAGVWKLNRELSDDIAARIDAVAGAAYMSGGPSWAAETWFPWGTSFSEGQRVAGRCEVKADVPGGDEGERAWAFHLGGIGEIDVAGAGWGGMSGDLANPIAGIVGVIHWPWVLPVEHA